MLLLAADCDFVQNPSQGYLFAPYWVMFNEMTNSKTGNTAAIDRAVIEVTVSAPCVAYIRPDLRD